MGKCRTGLDDVLKNIVEGPQRSTLFYWLVEHHDEIAQAAAGRSIRWEPLRVRFAELGLTDGDGKPATAETSRLTWFKVRKEVLKHRTLRATGMLPRPAATPPRPPANWMPPGLTQQNAASPSGGVHQGGQTAALPPVLPRQPEPPAPAGPSQDSSRPAPGSIEAAWEKLNLRSGLKANGDPLYKR